MDKQGGCNRARTGLQGPGGGRPWDTRPGKSLRCAAARLQQSQDRAAGARRWEALGHEAWEVAEMRSRAKGPG